MNLGKIKNHFDVGSWPPNTYSTFLEYKIQTIDDPLWPRDDLPSPVIIFKYHVEFSRWDSHDLSSPVRLSHRVFFWGGVLKNFVVLLRPARAPSALCSLPRVLRAIAGQMTVQAYATLLRNYLVYWSFQDLTPVEFAGHGIYGIIPVPRFIVMICYHHANE